MIGRDRVPRGVAVTLPLPLSVAHGGREIQALRSMEALRTLGVAVEPLDPWDPAQGYGLLHCFGTDGGLWEIAERVRAKGTKVVVSPVLVFGKSTSRFRAWARVDRFMPLRTSFRYRRDLLRLAHAVIALTRTEQRVLEGVYGVPPSRCHVIPNGVEDVFRDTTAYRHLEPWAGGGYVLCVGSIEARKGQLRVLRAAQRAGRRVVFIGSVRQDDPYGAAFERELQHSENVVWHQRLEAGSEALAGAYAAADALVVASSAEGMPLVALEARAAGCPLILTDLPQHIEAFPGATFVRTGDEGALTRAFGATPARTADVPAPGPWSWPEVATELRRVYHSIAPEIVPLA
jgi:glycosyltransferase involved in cell wall biosynthesis